MENNVDSDMVEISRYVSPDKQRIVVKVHNELDLKLSYKLQTYLMEQLNSLSAGGDLYIDLRDVEYIASSGVGAMSNTLVQAKKFQINLYVSTLKPKVRAVFDLLGLTSYFTEKNPDAAKY